tara:strand:+ start:642 stop:1646 length:1005 start_codon:yes stop_codon:yes gene_type:complete
MLSTMLACHPQALMLSECLGALDRRRHLKKGVVTKDELQEILQANIPIIDMCAARGRADKETLRDLLDPSKASPPGILIAALPFLTDKPDELFSDMLCLTENFPSQTMGEHYDRIFVWLQQRFGKSFWIERTGDSIAYVDQLYETFPDAKYLHIQRHGPEVVLSMSQHVYFSMVASLFSKQLSREEIEQTEFASKPVSENDPISQRMFSHPASLEEVADLWNYELLMGYKTFAKMDASQFREVRFEDIISKPAQTIEEIADFFDMPASPDWIDQAASKVDASIVSSSVTKLSEAAQASLEKACMPGQILQGRVNHPWILPSINLMYEYSAAGKA